MEMNKEIKEGIAWIKSGEERTHRFMIIEASERGISKHLYYRIAANSEALYWKLPSAQDFWKKAFERYRNTEYEAEVLAMFLGCQE